MTFTVSPDDLERHMDAIVQNETFLFGDDGYDKQAVHHFDKHPRYSTGMILTPKNDLAGYAFMRHIKNGVIRILRLCVIPEHRKNGYGKNLHDAILMGGHTYRLRVPERWLEAQIWLRDLGWVAIGIAPDGIEFRIFVETDPFVVS